jgi:hypothetical protein
MENVGVSALVELPGVLVRGKNEHLIQKFTLLELIRHLGLLENVR